MWAGLIMMLSLISDVSSRDAPYIGIGFASIDLKAPTSDATMTDLNSNPIVNIKTYPIIEDIELSANDCWIVSMPMRRNYYEIGNFVDSQQNSYERAKECYEKPIYPGDDIA
jgi:hypothetical protein